MLRAMTVESHTVYVYYSLHRHHSQRIPLELRRLTS